jgi:hypothetical protein
MPLIAGLAVLWFVVIAWATRDTREAAHDGRSIDKYSHAMRVLSRREPQRTARPATAGGRYIVVPTERVTNPMRSAQSLVDRRRAMLRRLVVASGISFAGLLLGGPWLWIHLLVDAVLVTYVVFLRRAALRAAEITRRERRIALDTHEAEHRARYEAAHGESATVLSMPEPAERRRAVGD